MADNFVGEIRMVGFNFAPQGWFMCDGALLSISDYFVLFNLIGTTYGGDGVETFGLPDLRGRRVVHAGSDPAGRVWTQGEISGEEQHTISQAEYAAHTHPLAASSTAGSTSNPAGAVWAAASGSTSPYKLASATAMNAAAVTPAVGGNLPHENMPPFLTITYIIAWSGIYPSPN